MMRESLWDSLKRWRKTLKAKLSHRPYFNIKEARRNFLELLASPVSLPKIQEQELEVIVSLTTFPMRIHTVGWSLLSLFKQSVLPHRIILNLSLQEFPDKRLPEEIIKFQEFGLEVFWCEDNTLSYKKIIPTIERYPDAIIITCDDDQYYEEHWLKGLLESYKKDPTLIHAHRVHRVVLDENFFPLPYNQWHMSIDAHTFSTPSLLNFATGVGGILYPPHCFFEDILKKEIYVKICPKADDIWLWGMEILANTKIKAIASQTKQTLPTMVTQKVALHKENLAKMFNDKQLKQLIEYYPQIIEVLKEESFYQQSST